MHGGMAVVDGLCDFVHGPSELKLDIPDGTKLRRGVFTKVCSVRCREASRS